MDEQARRGSLALAVQEALTTAVRLRANRQRAADAESFRAHLRAILAAAEERARHAGYGSSEIRRAVYAVVAFLDESVLNSGQPIFADWQRKPLQEEIFGGHMGGEVFFRNLRELLERNDSDELADVLEVHQLCLLLGFKGQYAMSHGGEIDRLIMQTGQRIDRIRGTGRLIAPHGLPNPNEHVALARDPWLRRLAIISTASAGLAASLFVIYLVLLRSGLARVSELQPVLR